MDISKGGKVIDCRRGAEKVKENVPSHEKP
jgi:hypothetical protein